jgi:hypothetical protein
VGDAHVPGALGCFTRADEINTVSFQATLAKTSLFLAGVFFGGMLDHTLLALRGETETHYGLAVGVAGNWAFALLDLGVTVAFYLLHRRLEQRSAMVGG